MDPDLINPELTDDELFQKLNGETAKLSWKELEPHFARGVVIRIASELDLVQVATSFIHDDSAKIKALMSTGEIATVTDEEAIHWNKSEHSFWAVVIAPWILAQEINKN